MTSNSIAYAKAQEERRANRVSEHNKRKELAEQARSNREKEAISRAQVEATKEVARRKQMSTLPGIIAGGLEQAGQAIQKGFGQLKKGNLSYPLWDDDSDNSLIPYRGKLK